MESFWLIEEGTLAKLESMLCKIEPVTKAQSDEYAAEFALSDSGMPRNMSVSGDRATIEVKGILTDTPDFFAWLFGGGNTVYSDVRTALAIAETDPNIKEIHMSIGSPGGHATPEWVDTMSAIKNATKPIHAFVGKMACSAAYGIASQCDSITAQNELSLTGSIGVILTVRTKSNGQIEITSSNAPNKNPDPTTPEGKTEILSMLDSIESVFIDRIAEGRGVDVATVKSDFGRGGVFLAEQALEKGMIDAIAGDGVNNHNKNVADGGENQTMEATMDVAMLQKDFPDVFAAVKQQGHDEGKAAENKRVTAHLDMGESYGAMNVANEAIKDGSDIDNTYIAKYLCAGKNQEEVSDRETTDDNVGSILAGTKTVTDTDASAEEAEAIAMITADYGLEDK